MCIARGRAKTNWMGTRRRCGWGDPIQIVSSPRGSPWTSQSRDPAGLSRRTHRYEHDLHELVRRMAQGSRQGCCGHNQLQQINHYTWHLQPDKESYAGNRIYLGLCRF